MTWLFIPYRFVPATEDLNSDSGSHSEKPLELCVTSSGNPTRRLLSWRGWKTRGWMKRLSGTTLKPSTASRGVESWIASLRATRVSRSRPQESDREMLTSGICGRTLQELYERLTARRFSDIIIAR